MTVEQEADSILEEAYQHLITLNYNLDKLTKDDISYLTYIICCGNINNIEGTVHETARYKEIMKKLGGISMTKEITTTTEGKLRLKFNKKYKGVPFTNLEVREMCFQCYLGAYIENGLVEDEHSM